MALVWPWMKNRFVGTKPMHEGCCASLRPAYEKEIWGLIVPVQPDSYLSRGDAGIERRAKVRSDARIILLHFVQVGLRNRVISEASDNSGLC